MFLLTAMASLAPKASILGFGEIICNILEGSLGGRFLILIRDVVHIGVRRVLGMDY